MKRFKFLKLGIFILSSLLITSTALAGGLPGEWTEIDPVEEYPNFEYNGLTPSCSGYGSAYGIPDKFTFFVKGGKKNKLVIFFDGGGACWNTANCLIDPTYQPYQDEVLGMFSDNNEGFGIFDTTEKDNPFKDWGFVFIPYCTGDLHWGANDADYTYDGIADIKHRGFVNFKAVLKYLKDNVCLPNKIFVTGSSAGSYGATLSFPYIKQAYPFSWVYLLGDAGNGVMGGNFATEGIPNWNVQMPDWIFPDGYLPSMTMAEVYTDIAAEYPWSKLAQYTTDLDETQIGFLSVMINIEGGPEAWYDPINLYNAGNIWYPTMLNYAYSTAAASPNYRYYIAAGSDHTIMMTPKFYTEDTAGGIPYAKWIKAMVRNPFGTHSPILQGKWKNLECEECF